MTWAIKWKSKGLLAGGTEYLMGRLYGPGAPKVPALVAGYTTMVFKTRADARAHIKRHWGDRAKRPDLRREPHNWRMPVPVKVRVEVTEVRR